MMRESDATATTDSAFDPHSEQETDADYDFGTPVWDVSEGDSLSPAVASVQLDDWDDLVPTIVDLVAEQEGSEPWALEPRLDTAINAEALEALFANTVTGERYDGVVSFPFHGYAVTVASTGVVSLHSDD